MNQHDDDDWLETLAGKGRQGAAPATQLEATWLRDALRRDTARQQLAAEAIEPATDGLQRLLARSAAEGLADATAQRRRWLPGLCHGCAARWRLAWAWLHAGRTTGWAAAGTLATAALLGAWLVAPVEQPATEAPVLRHAPGALQVFIDAQPLLRRDRLAATLESAGVSVRRYERLGRHGLDAELPWPLPAALGQALREQGLQTPKQAELKVEFAPPAP